MQEVRHSWGTWSQKRNSLLHSLLVFSFDILSSHYIWSFTPHTCTSLLKTPPLCLQEFPRTLVDPYGLEKNQLYSKSFQTKVEQLPGQQPVCWNAHRSQGSFMYSLLKDYVETTFFRNMNWESSEDGSECLIGTFLPETSWTCFFAFYS